MNKNKMKENKSLLSNFKQKILDDRENKITASFTVFKTPYKQSFYYAIHFTHFLQ